MKEKVILLNVWKSKKGKVRVGVGIPVKGDDQFGYNYSENWYDSYIVDYDHLKNNILDEYLATFEYRDTFGGNAIKYVGALSTLDGEIVLG